MEYFSNFPVIAYDFSTDKEKISYLLRDITKNVRFRKDAINEIVVYDEYDIIDGETPEMIASKVYGSPLYHWVVMLANESYDWIRDYPLTDSELDRYIEDKYGSIQQAMNKTKHYQNSDGFVVYFDPANSDFHYTNSSGETVSLNYSDDSGLPPNRISCYDYEIKVNESKRRIKIIAPFLLNQVITTFRDIM